MDTVTPPTSKKEVMHMGLTGYIIGACLVLVMFPLLPLLVGLKLLDVIRKGGGEQSS